MSQNTDRPREGVASSEPNAGPDGIQIPRLSDGKSLESCRGTTPLRDATAKAVILTRAKELYEHEKNSTIWTKQTQDGRNQLIFFIHRLEQGLFSPGPIRPKDSNDASHPTQRAHRRTSSSPRQRDLSDYEDVFYATCAKTRELHENLAIRFESGFLTPDAVLHERGENLLSYAPFTAREMLKYLEVTWSILLDPRLLIALDNSVRRDRVRHSQGVTLEPNFDPNNNTPEFTAHLRRSLTDRLGKGRSLPEDALTGLMDVAKMSPGHVNALLWEKYRPLVAEEQRLKEHENLLRARHAAEARAARFASMSAEEHRARALAIIDGRSVTPAPADVDIKSILDPLRPFYGEGSNIFDSVATPSTSCDCMLSCICKTSCFTEPEETCLCKRSSVFREYAEQVKTASTVRDVISRNYGKQLGDDIILDAPNNDVAQLQIAAVASDFHPVFEEALSEVRSVIEEMETDYVERKLVATGMKSPALTITPVKSSKKTKDPYPLDFYSSPSIFDSPTAFDSGYDTRSSNVVNQTVSIHTPPQAHESQDGNAYSSPALSPTTDVQYPHTSKTLYVERLPPPPFRLERSETEPPPAPKRFFTDPAFTQMYDEHLREERKSMESNLPPMRIVNSVPMQDRIWYSAGGNRAAHDRIEVEWDVPTPIAKTFSYPAEEFIAMLPNPYISRRPQDEQPSLYVQKQRAETEKCLSEHGIREEEDSKHRIEALRRGRSATAEELLERVKNQFTGKGAGDRDSNESKKSDQSFYNDQGKGKEGEPGSEKKRIRGLKWENARKIFKRSLSSSEAKN
ncbi:hypothetical protein AOQ84DRAFT_384020 [Glonium stellatum]|uniref:Uncharacterized protein n=1 Tax=Glonium stellatum TaxID=574774 RepID=A0A8E2FF50_9PEZI|nr:hypothetical protein AOQ84DRAFT_384020 [Glonium stellatum]